MELPGTVERRRRRLSALPVLLAFLVVLAGCQDIPSSASKADFCNAGRKFSALEKVPFAEGKKAIDRLAKVGTPADIDGDARDGFVELIDRMDSSDTAADFRQETRTMTESERSHLFALDSYIQGTCSDRVPLTASKTDFCASYQTFASVKSDPFEEAVQAIGDLAKIGTPNDIDASARLGFIELIDRVNSSLSFADFTSRTKTMNVGEQTHYQALADYIKKACGT